MTTFFCAWKSYARSDSLTRNSRAKEWKSSFRIRQVRLGPVSFFSFTVSVSIFPTSQPSTINHLPLKVLRRDPVCFPTPFRLDPISSPFHFSAFQEVIERE